MSLLKGRYKQERTFEEVSNLAGVITGRFGGS